MNKPTFILSLLFISLIYGCDDNAVIDSKRNTLELTDTLAGKNKIEVLAKYYTPVVDMGSKKDTIVISPLEVVKVRTELDEKSLEKLNKYMKENFDSEMYSKDAIKVFHSMAANTDGESYLSKNPSAMVKTVIKILESKTKDNADICILVDKTGSMYDDIDTLRQCFSQIIKAVKLSNNIRLSLAFYGDKNVDGDLWFEAYDFTKDYDSIADIFNTFTLSGGGDEPESVNDGAYNVIEQLNWKSKSKRMILLIGDAPSLEPPLSDHSLLDVILLSKSKKIKFNFYPVIIANAYSFIPPVADTVSKSERVLEAKKEELETKKLYEAEQSEAKKKEEQRKIDETGVKVAVYPNPVSSVLFIQTNTHLETRFEIYDSRGKLVYVNKLNKDKTEVDVSIFAAGVYHLRVYTNNDDVIIKRKFIVNRISP